MRSWFIVTLILWVIRIPPYYSSLLNLKDENRSPDKQVANIPVCEQTTAQIIRSEIRIPGAKKVLLDRYFNSEQRIDSSGKLCFWHYDWNEKSDPGFSRLGDIFTTHGAELSVIDQAPDVNSLAKADIYIIVDPDNLKDNPKPNFVSNADIAAIKNWVKAGGVLMLMANDSANCDLEHFNSLAGQFGIKFLNESINLVKNDQFETGAVIIHGTHAIFQQRKLFLKDISPLQARGKLLASVVKGTDTIMAACKFGRGTVFAVGDPWLYNEYLNGRLPSQFDNHGAAQDLVKWLLKQSRP